jgi:AcrR family transcriptional regulator
VHVAVELLDESGADALTFRVLAVRLSTGPGAIYHHVANKAALLAAAASEVVTSTLDLAGGGGSQQDVCAVLLSTFDAIDDHPWLGTQLTVAPWQPAVLQLLERVGSHLDALGVPEPAQFDAASVLVHHVLGFASQFDAATHLSDRDVSRLAFLEQATTTLTQQRGGDQYPFLSRVAEQLAGHDDREQYKTGLDVILAGIATL